MDAINSDKSVPTEVLDLFETERSLVESHRDNYRALVHLAQPKVSGFSPIAAVASWTHGNSRVTT